MQYNNDWLMHKHQRKEEMEFLFFWGHHPNKDGSISKTCFSQWWVAPFDVDGVSYPTAEHWMMAGKARLFNDQKTLELILATETPAEAKNKGRLVKLFDAAIWDKEKFNIVVEGNMHKFSSNYALREFLLNTHDKVLVEASPVDRIWGIGLAIDDAGIQNPLEWKGENLLGYALMEVRDQLKRK